jgi:Fe(3+) dicitrate transport protein
VFSIDRFIVQKISNNGGGNDVMVNIKGNFTPYAPGMTASGYLHYDAPSGFGIRLGGHFTGSQYTDVLNTECMTNWFGQAKENPDFQYVQATASGQIGKMPSFFVMNLSAWHDLPGGLNLNMSLKNLLDERYITSRRPQGIRVGLPRMLNAGLTYNF